jgi:hypothetical protein
MAGSLGQPVEMRTKVSRTKGRLYFKEIKKHILKFQKILELADVVPCKLQILNLKFFIFYATQK